GFNWRLWPGILFTTCPHAYQYSAYQGVYAGSEQHIQFHHHKKLACYSGLLPFGLTMPTEILIVVSLQIHEINAGGGRSPPPTLVALEASEIDLAHSHCMPAGIRLPISDSYLNKTSRFGGLQVKQPLCSGFVCGR